MRRFPRELVDVLFAAYGGGHVTMLRPLAKVLPTDVSFAFLGLTTAQADLERHGLDYFGYAELDGANDPQVQAWGRELVGPQTANASVPYTESVAYHGLNFRDLVAERGEADARAHYALHGRQGFLPVKTMEALLTKLRPKVVVATNSPRSERALFEAARNLGIPSICVVDLFAIQGVKWISKPGYASRICVLNQQVANFLLDNGCTRDAVIVTGNPAFDTISSPEIRESGRLLREERGFSADDKVILWASNVEPERHPFTGIQGDPSLPRRVETELRRLVAQKKHWNLVVRYHPSETAEFLPIPKVTLSPRQENLHALLNAVDVAVVMSSTVGLEAHLAGRPVISVDTSIFTADSPYSKMGISTGVAEISELQGVLESTLNQRHTASHSTRNQGFSTKLVLQQILELLSNNPNIV